VAAASQNSAFGTRPAPWQPAAYLALAILGLGVSAYLTTAHYEQFTLACATTSVVDCASVTHSVYAQFFGTALPVSAAGMGWFLVAGAIGALGLRMAASHRTERQSLRIAAGLWSMAGLLYVLYLVYVELVRVNRICEWCTAVHVIVFAMLLISLSELQTAA
jgi:uncharacterized membrane protein